MRLVTMPFDKSSGIRASFRRAFSRKAASSKRRSVAPENSSHELDASVASVQASSLLEEADVPALRQYSSSPGAARRLGGCRDSDIASETRELSPSSSPEELQTLSDALNCPEEESLKAVAACREDERVPSYSLPTVSDVIFQFFFSAGLAKECPSLQDISEALEAREASPKISTEALGATREISLEAREATMEISRDASSNPIIAPELVLSDTPFIYRTMEDDSDTKPETTWSEACREAHESGATCPCLDNVSKDMSYPERLARLESSGVLAVGYTEDGERYYILLDRTDGGRISYPLLPKMSTWLAPKDGSPILCGNAWPLHPRERFQLCADEWYRMHGYYPIRKGACVYEFVCSLPGFLKVELFGELCSEFPAPVEAPERGVSPSKFVSIPPRTLYEPAFAKVHDHTQVDNSVPYPVHKGWCRVSTPPVRACQTIQDAQLHLQLIQRADIWEKQYCYHPRRFPMDQIDAEFACSLPPDLLRLYAKDHEFRAFSKLREDDVDWMLGAYKDSVLHGERQDAVLGPDNTVPPYAPPAESLDVSPEEEVVLVEMLRDEMYYDFLGLDQYLDEDQTSEGVQLSSQEPSQQSLDTSSDKIATTTTGARTSEPPLPQDKEDKTPTPDIQIGDATLVPAADMYAYAGVEVEVLSESSSQFKNSTEDGRISGSSPLSERHSTFSEETPPWIARLFEADTPDDSIHLMEPKSSAGTKTEPASVGMAMPPSVVATGMESEGSSDWPSVEATEVAHLPTNQSTANAAPEEADNAAPDALSKPPPPLSAQEMTDQATLTGSFISPASPPAQGGTDSVAPEPMSVTKPSLTLQQAIDQILSAGRTAISTSQTARDRDKGTASEPLSTPKPSSTPQQEIDQTLSTNRTTVSTSQTARDRAESTASEPMSVPNPPPPPPLQGTIDQMLSPGSATTSTSQAARSGADKGFPEPLLIPKSPETVGGDLDPALPTARILTGQTAQDGAEDATDPSIPVPPPTPKLKPSQTRLSVDHAATPTSQSSPTDVPSLQSPNTKSHAWKSSIRKRQVDLGLLPPEQESLEAASPRPQEPTASRNLSKPVFGFTEYMPDLPISTSSG